MKLILALLAATFFLAACGKKAPLRPPEDPPEKSDRG
jgi:predicted small lipoprotein YifL